jgi:hypothetical protein
MGLQRQGPGPGHVRGEQDRVHLTSDHVTGETSEHCSLHSPTDEIGEQTSPCSLHENESPLYIATVMDRVVRSFVLNLKYRSQR